MARSARSAGRQAAGAGLLVAAGLVLACAKLESPPGGPPDAAPPVVVAVRPESGAAVPGWKNDAVIQFDEVIEEPQDLARYVLLSPVAGDVRITWARTRLRVKPKEGWQANRVYRLELLPGLVDLRRNRLDTGTVAVFSTGPAIGRATLRGTALAWVEQRHLPGALIEAVPLPDSAGYRTVADSGGTFALGALRPGRYVVYATADQNNNRRRDRREAFDSAVVTLDSAATVALYAFVHDTAGPRLRIATAVDSVTVRLEFSQALDPVPLDTGRVRLLALPDSVPVPFAVWTMRQYDSLVAAERAAARAADTTRADSAPSPPPPSGFGPRGGGPAAAARPPAPVDTALVRRLLGARGVPSDRVILRTARPLPPGTRYFVRVRGATNLTGAIADGQAIVSVPRAAPPRPQTADTTRRGVRDTL